MFWEPLNLTTTCPTYTGVTACSLDGFLYLNLLIQLFGKPIDRRDHRDEYYDKKSHNRNKWEYDFIVIGAGSAGCVVANRLTENPNWNVLLIEAGSEEPEITLPPSLAPALLGSSIDWQYTTEPNGKSCLARGGRCAWPRGKSMGGSSAINSMAYVRGNKVDYDGWYNLGNPGWSYKEVLPFFKKSEKNLNKEALNRKYHGVDGEQAVSRYPYEDQPSMMLTEAFNEGGLPLTDYNAGTQEGTMQAQAFSKDGERMSTNVAFILPIKNKRKNLTIKMNSEVFEIIIEHGKANGIKYEHEGEIYTVHAKKEIIISAGSINSPKLLMLSGVGPREHLESLGIRVKKNLAVGENLHDHVTFNGVLIALPNKTATLLDQDQIRKEIEEYKYMKIKKGPISAHGPVDSLSFLKSEPGLIAPDVQYQVDHVTYWREYIHEPTLYEKVTIFPASFYDGIIPRVMNLVPKSRGCILLNSTHPYEKPLLYPNYFENEEDFLPLLRGVRFLLSLENTNAFKSKGAYFVRDPLPACKDYHWGTDEYYICLAQSYTSSTYHPVGTCKMGPKWDSTAVVDNKLRVYGIRNLRVIDSSIMPVLIRGNTNAPTIMIGERGVDFVIKYWNRSERP